MKLKKAGTVEEIGEFWDSHSLDDYRDQTREVEFEVRAKHRRRITLDPEIYERVEVQAHPGYFNGNIDQPVGS